MKRMNSPKKPLSPVRPTGLDLVFFYQCPFCERQIPVISPTQPTMAMCDSCRGQFPIVPADARSVQYVKIMLANGKAGIDPDFL